MIPEPVAPQTEGPASGDGGAPAGDGARIKAARVALPKGGGAIQGIGANFQNGGFTGAAAFSVPIPVTSCRGGAPDVTLQYRSGSGNGLYGLGFDIGLPAITRQTSSGQPRYDGTDTFLLPDGTPLVCDALVPVGHRDGHDVFTYRPRVESTFAAIEHWIDPVSQKSFWRVLGGDNSQTFFGRDDASRIADPSAPTHIFSWLIDAELMARGDAVAYRYRPENDDNVPPAIYEHGRAPNANKYPDRILYGNDRPVHALNDLDQASWHFEIVFDYGEYSLDPLPPDPYRPPAGALWAARADPFSIYNAGFEIRTYRLCRHVLMFHRFAELGPEPVLVHMTRFSYSESPVLTQLRMIEALGCRLNGDAYTTQALPPLELGYTPFAPSTGQFEPMVNGFGRPVPGVTPPGPFQLADLYGEGIPGILFRLQSTVLFLAPLGPQPNPQAGPDVSDEVICYAPPCAPARFPGLGLADDTALIDITGCGRPALVAAAPDGTRFSQAQADGSWAPFLSLPAVPTDLFQPDTMTADMTGDGLTDLLRLDPETVSVYPSRGAQGYRPALVLPRAGDMPMSGEESATVLVRMTDIFGSGREHLVRITNGSVEVWPNLGYGKFGRKIALGNAPHFGDDFDASRLFLADIDGSGTTDLLYLHHGHIDLYVNQSGNSFADAVSIPLPGGWQPAAQVEFADVRGNGTTALVYAPADGPRLYIAYDFGCRTKPYLLNMADDNTGLVTHLSYRASTYHALRDRQAGMPWATELPFPVQVVDEVEVLDAVSGTRLVSRYDYRHGYYDPVEREFCGFGQVDCIDSLGLDDYLANTKDAAPDGYAPPSLTRSWYHTGAWGGGASPCNEFDVDYFHGDPLASRLPPARFTYSDTDPDGDTMRQAHYALKGMVLREEVYGLDGSAQSNVPYQVTETTYGVRQDQAVAEDGYGAFFIYPLETLTLHYERNLTDPRVTHDVTLAVDAYGATTRACSIAYARRASAADRLPEQVQLRITVQTHRVADLTGPDLRLLGLDIDESDGWLVAPVPPAGEIFTFDEISAQVDAALLAPAGKLKLLGRQRRYYWDPAAKQPLPLGQATGQGLLCRIENALGTPTDLNAAFAGALAPDQLATLLAGTCQYLQSDGLWWNPGLLQTFLGADDYYLPGDTVDPFGGVTAVLYDPYDLLVVRNQDPLGNVNHVTGIDYQTVGPWQMTDPNGTVTQALCNALGWVWATSVQGTEITGPVGFAPLTLAHTAPAFDMAAAMATPQVYLQGTASFSAYELFSWCGRIAPSDLAGLGVNSDALWQALIDGFYIARSGAVLHRFRTLGDDSPMVLPGIPAQTAAAVQARIVALVTPTPVHSVALAAETYGTSDRTRYVAAYSDGLGRAIQKIDYVDPGDCYRVNPDGSVTQVESDNRWLVSGRVVYNNKGKPIKQYDPFFADGWAYIDNAEMNRFGVSPLIHYDPLDREIRVDTPKGFFTKVEFSPWEERLYDADDTVVESRYYQANIDNPLLDALERAALQQATLFNDTPTIRQFDPSGNAVRITQTLQPPAPSLPPSGLTTRNVFDAMNRLVASADDRMRAAGLENLTVVYGLDGQKLASTSVDSGVRWLLNNAAGNPAYGRDAKGTIQTTTYDALQRPLELTVQEASGAPYVARKTIYGESVSGDAGHNLREQIYQISDAAGVMTFDAYTIGGELLDQKRQLLQGTDAIPDWSKLDPVDIYLTRRTYDALGRIRTQAVERADAASPDLVTYVYDIAGHVDAVSLTPSDSTASETYADSITYDANGQRRQIVYGNGVVTQYTYEPTTQFLATVVSVRQSDGATLQSLRYYYDPVGNITAVADDAQSTVFHANQQVDPVSTYAYDAVYRLITATGREHPALSAGDSDRFVSLPALNDGQALQNYTRRYRYDTSGNLYQIAHQGSVPATSDMTVSPTSNRAVAAALTTDPARVDTLFDANGNQIAMAGKQAVTWRYDNLLVSVTLVERDSSPSDIELYVYDSQGQRIRKITRRYGNGGTTENVDETLYIDGMEIRRHATNGTVDDAYRTIRVMDGERCLAERLNWTIGAPPSGVPSPQVRYQLENYLGSAVFELDATGLVITYEEYFPYGGTSYVIGENAAEVQLKHYRYSGKERDATGLYYYGLRYYQPWLGRWLNPDPAGTIDGLNLYRMVRNNPVTLADVAGLYGVADWLDLAEAPDRHRVNTAVMARRGVRDAYERVSQEAQAFLKKAQNNTTEFNKLKPRKKLERDIELKPRNNDLKTYNAFAAAFNFKSQAYKSGFVNLKGSLSQKESFDGIELQGANFSVTNKDTLMSSIKEAYGTTHLHKGIEKITRLHIAETESRNGGMLSNFYGIPALHAEVQAFNWSLNNNMSPADTVIFTLRLTTNTLGEAGDDFPACYNCDALLSLVHVTTGRTTSDAAHSEAENFRSAKTLAQSLQRQTGDLMATPEAMLRASRRPLPRGRDRV
ncbi:SpvB/TcaC N-terminal domain-containing protein [Burkholderia stagnalis]|uniref:SpvB/TcaC N-terminal domain-containing protein n=1 Tax=Burkholderia stagnalis TaxID=1503054 RepID=UPI000F57363C|nr:SpvB/TcaC N-terminal domain-containing protein [Burkholderia stagnalis]RQQ03499.1 toxin [Burkholderia stagnalis]RQQ11889.1 toxin [Burkholderia stagnalis]RQQ27241.1 toxin [Burkholderia stagnalis]RQQ30258.1 toxin [Burkholderia stagnalis]RQQ30371.1 toxin [Burkholderia stagnalis]